MARKARPRPGAAPRRGRAALKTPPQYKGSKKWADLTPKYRARLLRGFAQGKTQQEARGHAKEEHVGRRERELREGETTYQRGAIKRFAQRQAQRSEQYGGTVEEATAQFRRLVREHGWGAFAELREGLDRLARQKRYRYRPKGKARKVIDLAPRIAEANARKAANIRQMQEWQRLYGVSQKYLFYHRTHKRR